MIKNIAMVTGLLLFIAVDSVSAESILTAGQLDRITAGVIETAFDENAFFQATAEAGGMTAEADAEVGTDFGLATSSAKTSSALSADAFSHATVTSKDAVPQSLTSAEAVSQPPSAPRAQTTPRRLLAPTSRMASARVR